MKIVLFLLFDFLVIALLILFAGNSLVITKSNGKHYSSILDIPANSPRTALLLGCSQKLSGNRTNPYFKKRIDAVVTLYKSGKIDKILVSGDNGTVHYSEPEDMRDALVKRGIPLCAITLDFAGFRTLDSVVRAKKVFGLSSFIIVSQKFHNQRALFIAESYDIKAIGYNAKDFIRYDGKQTITQKREYLARAKAFIDLYILFKSPKFLGNQEKMNAC